MRKFLLLFLLIAILTFALDHDLRAEFLLLYYNGDYEKAHALLNQIFSDPETLQIWEERIHLQKEIGGCHYREHSTGGTRGTALLRIGTLQQAKAEFGDDGLSLLGLATLSLWQNNYDSARDLLSKALTKNPEHPDLLFFAGNLATSDEESLDYFRRFLALKTQDPLKTLSAEEAIEFIQKVKGMQLNVSSLASGMESLDSQFDLGRLLIKGKVDQKEEVTLLLDTGAAGLSLEQKNWQPRVSSSFAMIGLGENQITKGERVVFDQFSAGKFELKNAVAAIGPSLQSSGIDGIAGAVVFSDYVLLLPLKSGKNLTLFLPSDQDPVARLENIGMHFSTRVTLPFYFVNKMIVLKGRIKKSEEDMDILLDTGAQRSIISAAAAKKYVSIDYQRSHMANSRPGLVGLGGKIEDLLLAENVEVWIGPLKKNFNEMIALNLAEISEAMEVDLDLILGEDFLEGYTLMIDYKNRTVTFLK